MDLFDRLRAARPDDWRAYVAHPFVEGLGSGTLPAAAFQSYLVQDYLFLVQFARAYALAVYKGRTLEDMRAAHAGLKAILDVEMDLHVRLCGRWGLSPRDLERTPEARATTAYTRYVLDTGLRGDLLDLHVALAPCVVGYAEIAAALAARPGALSESNPYREWIAEYAGEPYREVAVAARATLDRLAARAMTEARFEDLASIFGQASRLEADFWSQGLEVLGG
ncbi:thiaminase II [Prosthecomicrobium sp. N25]|uniref:thiaminase II n=1 Tax=Prosthecomicrobium sp. N25 TaxID=3129254 RepID=UPI003076B6E7